MAPKKTPNSKFFARFRSPPAGMHLTALIREVNLTFASATLAALRTAVEEDPEDVPVIWIHDYHLMEVQPPMFLFLHLVLFSVLMPADIIWCQE